MKKYLLGLLVGFVSLISFGYCNDIIFLDETFSDSVYGKKWRDYFDFMSGTNLDLVCYKNVDCPDYKTMIAFNNLGGNYFDNISQNDAGGGLGICTSEGPTWISIDNTSCHISVKGYVFSGFSSEACQSEYDLISPESCPVYNLSLAPLGGNTENYSITGNVNVVVNNGIDYELDDHNNALWLSVGLNTDIGGQCSGDVNPGSGNRSALYINGIQHESASLIDINIADYVPWDYSINDDVFDLDIGSGYDQDYIDGVIDVQSYRPTSEDFTQTFVGGLILFTPYIVILLFVILVWNLIKKIFKTK